MDDRRATPPWTGVVFLGLGVALLVFALVFESGRTAFLVQAAAWFVVGLVVLAVRHRRRR